MSSASDPRNPPENKTALEWAHNVGIALAIIAFMAPLSYCKAESNAAYYQMKADCFKAGGTWRKDTCKWEVADE